MALLHHWTVATCRSVIRDPSAGHCWQVAYPQAASQHAFAMQGILSLSAVHLAHTDRSNGAKHALNASRHHGKAIRGFRESLDHMSDENCHALFACATLNMVYVFAVLGRQHRQQHDEDPSPTSHISRVLGTEWIPLIRGIQYVLIPVYEEVKRGPLGIMLDLGNWNELDPDDNPVPQDDAFQKIRAAWAESDDASIYDEASFVLRKCHKYIAHFTTAPDDEPGLWGWNREWAGPLRFLFFAPEPFFSRLRQRQPPALLIFAHLGGMLHTFNHYWFMEGWGRDIVQVVDGILGDYWRPWMAWPMEAVGLT